MSIRYHASTRRYHLTDGSVFSRILGCWDDPNEHTVLLDLYYGAALPDEAVDLLPYALQMQDSSDTFQQFAPYALPAACCGNYRAAALDAVLPDGSSCIELDFVSAAIEAGKPRLPGLPATYAEAEDNAESLRVLMEDRVTHLQVEQLWSVLPRHHALTCSARIVNGGTETVTLLKAISAAISLNGAWDVLHLHGQWAKERQVERLTPGHLIQTIESRRGASGHEQNPFVALLRPAADEFQGDVIGVSLVYSGSFQFQTQLTERDDTVLVAGLAPFRWMLGAGESLQLPEAVCVYSPDGLNGMSHLYHKLYRERLCRGVWRDRPRPILCNNWEATYFGFDEASILRIAKKAAELGVELFVLDDGWFGVRNNDDCSLGDWQVNLQKLPHGLAGLSDRIHALGLQFGLWMEPEMVSPNSDLYRAHPDWCIHVPNRTRTQARNQLVLDLTRTEVQDYIIDAVCRTLTEAKADYIKWDMNRNFCEVGSAALPAERQGEIAHRYMLGLYRILETVTARFPQVLFESCASGGGRFDPGMLYYMPQTWTSDDTDAVERLKIQYGTSMVYPASSMGAHVSAVPNHQVGRVTSMRFRGDVALGGNMGYELDLADQTEDDQQEIRRQIEQVRQLRRLTFAGRFTRLQSPFEHRITAWQFAAEDQSELLICLYRSMQEPNPKDGRIFVRDVNPHAIYADDAGNRYAGAVLLHQGLDVRVLDKISVDRGRDQASYVLHLTEEKAVRA